MEGKRERKSGLKEEVLRKTKHGKKPRGRSRASLGVNRLVSRGRGGDSGQQRVVMSIAKLNHPNQSQSEQMAALEAGNGARQRTNKTEKHHLFLRWLCLGTFDHPCCGGLLFDNRSQSIPAHASGSWYLDRANRARGKELCFFLCTLRSCGIVGIEL